MSTTTAAARYQKNSVKLASPVQIVSMLFDGAIRFANEASQAIEKKDRAHAGDRLNRSHAILEELASTLDHSHFPELCDNLLGIYGFCMKELLRANVEQDPAVLAGVVKVLTPLRDAWAELAKRPA